VLIGGVPHEVLCVYNVRISAGRLALDYRHKEKDSMILKMLDYEQMKHENAAKESWTYIDNIETARVTYEEDIKETVVSCTFKGDTGVTTFVVKHLAYLMSDDGKTIDRIRCAERDVACDDVYATLQEAASIAINDKD
jgi:hypothetical protein